VIGRWGNNPLDEPGKTRREVSIPSLIGWLSLCMLAATWGRTIDPQWQGWWAKAGTAGLIAAVVLDRSERKRLSRKVKVRENAARVISENRLAKLHEQESTRSSVIEAIHELTTYAGPELEGFPVDIVPISDDDLAVEIQSAHSIPGTLISTTPNTVSFSHNDAFDGQVVLLRFKLNKSRLLCFVVEIVGTQASGDGFTSTGAVLAAGVPDSTPSNTESTETLQLA
jgi:hypothetical protein